MRYTVLWNESCFRSLEALPREVRERIALRVSALAENPRPASSSRLKGGLAGLRRLRIGEHRVAYEIDEVAATVTVRAVGHRSRFYKDLNRAEGNG